MTTDDNGGSLSFGAFKFEDDTPAGNIAKMTLTRFLATTAKKLRDNSTPDQWIATSIRTMMPGMLDRYEEFSRSQGTSVFAVFSVQELHWLSYCQCDKVLSDTLAVYNKTHTVLTETEYVDLPKYQGDVPDLFIGKQSSIPLNIKHRSDIAGELLKFARALGMTYSAFTEIGRGWSLSTILKKSGARRYKGWADRIFNPLLQKTMERAELLTQAREEALVIFDYRKNLPKKGENGSVI